MPKLRFLPRLVMAVLALAVFASCSGTAPQPGEQDGQGATGKGKNRHAYPVERVSEKNSCYDILIEYPFLGRPQLDQQLRIWADAGLQASVDGLSRICADMPPRLARDPYSHIVDYEIYKTAHTVSVVFNSWVYTGGAHGNTSIESLNLRVENGDELHYSDIFADTDELYDFFSHYVYKSLYPSLGHIWHEAYMFTEGLEPVEESFGIFAITEKGITLFFPPYQIAPYSEGTQTCEVPLEELIRFKPRPGIWQ